jgi:GTPase
MSTLAHSYELLIKNKKFELIETRNGFQSSSHYLKNNSSEVIMLRSYLKLPLSYSKLFQGNFVRGLARKRKEIVLPVPKFQKRLDCVIFGVPNVGKSVLLNELVKQKLSATTHKRHTTRGEILGVFNHRNTQLVFYDTPGYIGKSDSLKQEMKLMRELASSSLEKSDVVLLVVDAARKITERTQFLFAEMVKIALGHAKKELILVLNKVDLVEPKMRLLEITKAYVSLINGIKLGPEKAHLAELDTTTFMISALHNDGVLDLKNYLIRIADMKAWLLKENQGITTLSEEERIEEIILEKLLENTHDEIPYIAEIQCTQIIREPRVLKINVEILLESGRQRKIVIGHQGRTMVKIRQASAEILEKIYQKAVLITFNIQATKE